MSVRFNAEFQKLMEREGFYSDDPNDSGGETVFGVARRAWPRWEGWKLVDEWRVTPGPPGFPANMKSDRRILDLAKWLYATEFWDPVKAEQLPEGIGEKVFDIAVNASPKIGALCLQVALCALEEYVRVDGSVGPITVSAAKEFDGDRDRLYDAIQAAHAGFYLGIIAVNPNKKIYRRGWLKRALEEAGQAGKIEVL